MSTSAAVLGLLLLFAASAMAGDPPKPPAPPPKALTVSEVDALYYEKYQLLQLLMRAQQASIQAQQAKALQEEWARLDARFRLHYGVSVNDVQRQGKGWIIAPPKPSEKGE